MNAFRLTTLTNGAIAVHGRVSHKDIGPEALRACQEVLRRLRAGEASVPYPSAENRMFEVRLGVPAWIEQYISIPKWKMEEYAKHYYHLTIDCGQTYAVCLVLRDEDEDEYAADMTVPLFLASIPGHIPEKKHTYRTGWNVAINRPVMGFVDLGPGSKDSELRFQLSEEFCMHFSAAMLGEPVPETDGGETR